MRIKRAIIAPALIALSAAGSIAAGAAVPLMASSAPVAAVADGPSMVYHG